LSVVVVEARDETSAQLVVGMEGGATGAGEADSDVVCAGEDGPISATAQAYGVPAGCH